MGVYGFGLSLCLKEYRARGGGLREVQFDSLTIAIAWQFSKVAKSADLQSGRNAFYEMVNSFSKPSDSAEIWLPTSSSAYRIIMNGKIWE